MATKHTGSAYSAVLNGAEGIKIELCATVSRRHVGQATFKIVDARNESAEREIRVRLQSALHVLGVDTHEWDIDVVAIPSVSLLPANDLAISVAILRALALAPRDGSGIFLGELSLGGEVRPARGVYPSLRACIARGSRVYVSPENVNEALEAGLALDVSLFTPETLVMLVEHLRGTLVARVRGGCEAQLARPQDICIGDVVGEGRSFPTGVPAALQEAAQARATTLLVGPPSGGKTMAARRIPLLMGAMTEQERRELIANMSVAGILRDFDLPRERPFRAPHHTVSMVGLVGGGDPVRPGEASLAHAGVLFLDEVAEFKTSALHAVMQVWAEGSACIVRRGVEVRFPARPMIVGAACPCPCGYFGSRLRECKCSDDRRHAYRRRVLHALDWQHVIGVGGFDVEGWRV